MITGPGSPSVLSNMAVSIEQHVDWVVDRLIAMREAGFTTIEATETAQAGWARHLADCAALTLHRLANTWYTGANVPGKAQGVMPYTGGVGPYRSICNEVVSRGMLGFRLSGPDGAEQCNDGEIVRLQPDVRLVLDMLAEMKLAADRVAGRPGRARLRRRSSTRRVRRAGRSARWSTARSPGADGPLPYRLYRPATPGPHPIVVYFHGGGWVLGDEQSDDPFCRDLCRRSGMIVRQRRLPARAGASLPGRGRGWLCGDALDRRACGRAGRHGRGRCWSRAGAPAATSLPSPASWRATAAGPQIAGQLLVCPVTDCTFERPSYTDNATGYFLTRSLMYWFWDLYCSPADRNDPRVSPLRGRLAGPAAGVRGDLRVRSAARRGRGLRRGAGGGRRAGRAVQGARPLPLVPHHGRRDRHRRRADACRWPSALRRFAGLPVDGSTSIRAGRAGSLEAAAAAK